MAKDNIAVYAIFPTRSALEDAVNALKLERYRDSDISVLFSSPETGREFAHEKNTKMPEGTATGAVGGAVIGGVLGWLAGIGSIAIPGVGPFIAAGPIMGLLAGGGVGGTIGALSGALIGLGIPEYEAKRYEGRITKGGILLSVHCDDSQWASKAKDILEESGGEDVGSRDEASAEIPSQIGVRSAGNL